MKPPCSTYSRSSSSRAAGELGGLVAVEEEDRRLEQVLERRGAGVDDLPGQQVSSSRARRCSTRLRMSSGSLFQSLSGAWRSLLIRTGARPLARNSSGEAGRQDRIALRSGASARTRRACPARGPAPRPPRDTSRARRRTACPRAGRRAPGHRGSSTSTAGRRRSSGRPGSGGPASRCPAWRLRLTPPLPQFWISSPWRNSCPWNRRSPVMIRLEIPAQVMLAVVAGESGVYAQPPSLFWHRSQ